MTLTPTQLRRYRYAFVAAAIYNIVSGLFVALFPLAPFRWAHLPAPDPITVQLWQCIGMFVLVWGVGYAYLAADPERYAPIALVGLLGKLLGPAGWAWGYFTGELPGVTFWVIALNDLPWWPVFVPFVWRTIIRPALRRTGPAADRPVGPPRS